MASIYKPLGSQDITSTKTLLNEAIPITGSIISGSYDDNNIKNYNHGMFQSVYDYPYLSSSSNHIFDIAVGYSPNSNLSSSTNTQNAKKINVYNQLAQVLMGYDKDGNIQRFDKDGNLTGGDKLDEVFFLNFSRLLSKDEISKGTFELELGVSEDAFEEKDDTIFNKRIKLTDASGSDGYFVNSPTGEYGVLYAQTSLGTTPMIEIETVGTTSTHPAVGLIFYQAGIVVISGSVFNRALDGGVLHDDNTDTVFMADDFGVAGGGRGSGFQHITGSEITASADALRARIYNLQFNNTIELNSTIHFCRVNHNEFNYSSNKTYLTGSSLRLVKNVDDQAISYVTTVGLYSADNQLMAVGKLSEPIRKDPTIELTFRVRLDY
jgi:hypothetical protein|tara:strand:- start:1792 stop:2928 length:1137 start_codon:yes stop_codon:yes gene_type:complete